MPRTPAALVVTLALTLPVPGAGAAHASGSLDSASPARAAATPQPADSGDERAPLSPDEVAEQVREAARLRQQLEADNAALAKAYAELEKAAATSAEAMDELAAARASEARAAAEENAQRARLRRLAAEVKKAAKDVDAMAADAYTSGTGSLKDIAALLAVLTTSPDDLSNASLAKYLADARAADKTRYAALAAEQQKVAAKAAAARLAREDATATAAAAKGEADASVAAQRQVVARVQAEIESTAAELEATVADVEAAQSARAAQAERRAARAARSTGPIDLTALDSLATTPLCSDDLGAHPNGRLPGSALCALTTAPGHMLRPDAARAYDALSAAYRKSTGNHLCITDSYRTFASQVEVRKRKPALAAVPGSSNHGFGTAVDLCGGVENFGAPAHQWMRAHAPLFGFFLPSWAQENGSKPEPWHWEYAG